MKTSYKLFIDELSKPKSLRKGFKRNRKRIFSVSDFRINELYDQYFSLISLKSDTFRFIIEDSDYDEIVYLLREHFRLWIEINQLEIIIYRDFPERYKIIKEVNKENHWFIPTTISKGTIMYLSKDHYGVVNWLNGIPLAVKEHKNEMEVNPVVQINYDFIIPSYN